MPVDAAVPVDACGCRWLATVALLRRPSWSSRPNDAQLPPLTWCGVWNGRRTTSELADKVVLPCSNLTRLVDRPEDAVEVVLIRTEASLQRAPGGAGPN